MLPTVVNHVPFHWSVLFGTCSGFESLNWRNFDEFWRFWNLFDVNIKKFDNNKILKQFWASFYESQTKEALQKHPKSAKIQKYARIFTIDAQEKLLC